MTQEFAQAPVVGCKRVAKTDKAGSHAKVYFTKHIEATRRLGAEICLVPGVYDDAYQRAMQLRDEMGYTFVHPFNDEHVIAGQGTIGLELLEQLPDVQAVVVPIGGGG